MKLITDNVFPNDTSYTVSNVKRTVTEQPHRGTQGPFTHIVFGLSESKLRQKMETASSPFR